MKIAMVSERACPRTQKSAVALGQHSHDVRLVSGKASQFWETYKSIHIYHNKKQLEASIKLLEPIVDIFHVHNEPTWLGIFVKELTDKPVLLDIHDSYLGRLTDDEEKERIKKGEMVIRISAEERTAFQIVDGLIFPCEPLKNIVCKEFNLEQPSLVMPSYIGRHLYNYTAAEYVGGITYEGMVMGKNMKAPGMGVFNYADYREFAKRCTENNIDFYIYLGNKKNYDEYKQYAITSKPQIYTSLLLAMARHDWGLVGNLNKTNEWKIALPNKLFEYMAAGIPIVCMNADESARWINDYGVGIVVNSFEEMMERWGEADACRENVIKHRMEFAMDNHIHELEQFYTNFI